MRADFRLARMLHALVHIHGRKGTTSSEELAVVLDTNPVLVRRMMGGLREAGYVRSTAGRNGGWVLAVDPYSITVLDVYEALEEPVIFAIGANVDHPGCALEQAINGALEVAMAQAAGALLREFGQVRLSAFIPAAIA
ncbi:Rrf2 family transcriptional regulator [Massilia aurea]|uniref:Rrf2 family transcriptional regulator n=1 Tax=Massilia aurea TaxID=373040 RepID=A0A422QFQ2_9BURK|nr:Rrf2 family transcriptional regulator [Massilia aurea]RNF28831.1 Rrf2 family transcriptional regulator [Massilia aurea]